MKVLVTGANGQLGYDVVKELQKQNIECFGATRKDFDIIDFEATRNFIINYSPDAVIHCAAYTAVDKAEDEKEQCYRIDHRNCRGDRCRIIGQLVCHQTGSQFDSGRG